MTSRTGPADRSVAVVGMGAVAPGANSPEEVWRVLTSDERRFRPPVRFDGDLIHSPDPEAEDRTFGRDGGYISGFRPHPVLAAEIERGDWGPSDSEVLWLRHCLLQALDGAGPRPGRRAGCYVATWTGATLAAEDTLLASYLARHMARGLASGSAARTAYEQRLLTRLRGRYTDASPRPRLVLPDLVVRRAATGLLPEDSDWLAVTAACASSLYAVDLGIASLLAGDCDIAYCGSLNGIGRLMAVTAAKFQGMSGSGDVRAFDANADGTLFSEAATMIAIKRYDRAVADGDRVLAVISGTGLATDGRGTTISTPHPDGLRRAITLAWADGTVTADDVSWVIAHGTGTLKGDQVEIDGLVDAAGPGRCLLCTSNKSLLGHAAWAAGGLSVIHAVKALEHGTIPGQRRFTTPHPALAGTLVHVPTGDVSWPAGDRPRVVGISGSGVGGANAHLLVRDRPQAPAHDGSRPQREQDDPLVLTAWSAWLPGRPEPEDVHHWLATGEGPPPHGFGDAYPASDFAATRLPPVVTEVIDRSHRMALDVAHRFVLEHGELWDGLREDTGILSAHYGPSESWADATVRAASGDLEAVPWNDDEQAAFDAVLAQVRARQRITDESLTGSVPDLAAYRIANRWDLHGPTMSIDSGATSALTALHVAARHLRQRRMKLALVLALNSSTTPETADFTESDRARLAEGAFLLALTRASVARERGWPVLAHLTTTTLREANDTARPTADSHDYLGAQGAVELLRRLVRGERAESVGASPGLLVTLTPPGSRQHDGDPARSSRGAIALRRSDARPAAEAGAAVPPSSVILVGSARLAAQLAGTAAAAGALLVSTDPATPPSVAAVVPEITDESSADAVLDRIAAQHPDIRVFAAVHRPVEDWYLQDPALDRLLEFALLAAKRCGERLTRGSFAVTVLDPLPDLQVHPDSAQFTGFVRALGWEIPRDRAFALVTDAPLDGALHELAAESAADRDAPVAYYQGGLRHTELLCPAPLPVPGPGDPVDALGPEPVVVAVGGARGIAAVALAELARRHRPVIWLLGRSDPGSVPPELLDAADGDEAQLRADFIRRGTTERPGPPIAELSRTFDRNWRAREAATNLRRLRRLCGAERVHYQQCDITDRAAVERVVATITSRHPRIDLLLNSAFSQESAQYTTKTLAGFRRAKDTKIAGYRHLKAAFAAAPPRRWCNFGSSIVLFGLPGETDYTAGSEYLAAAARYESRLLGGTAVTVNWGLWEEAGSAAAEATRQRLERTGVRTGVSNSEGCAYWLSELVSARPAEPAPVYTTGYDRQIAERRFPRVLATFDTADATDTADTRGVPAGLLGEPVETSPGRARWDWALSPGHDRYLLEHLVDGRPTLPGMAMVAMAAEAAGRLHPGMPVRQLRDIRFQEFVRADPRTPGPTKYRIVAEDTTAQDSATHRTVRVRVLSDVRTPGGRVLRSDRCHATLEVLLGPPQEPPPHWDTPPLAAGTRQTDPLCRSDSPIRLTGVFRNTVDILADEERAEGRFQPLLAHEDAFSHAVLPVLLLDALGRTCCFRLTGPGKVAVQAPTGIDRLDIRTPGPDSELATHHPAGIGLHGELTQDRYTAFAPDGTVLAQITGLHCQVFATLDAVLLPDRGHPDTEVAP
ncbi:SDR family oxidoreductase [Kitasatospora sp. NPDC088351]|uniref:SDR family oxidoreductase n=1 Tax=Kitasatospora sp. NPDC088351 TaxID=3155180 RepID=UPI003426A329